MRHSLEPESLVKHPDRFSTKVTMNMALKPLMKNPERYSKTATIIFLNDVSFCMEDILELIHQHAYQNADMTCPMDWTFDQGLEVEPTFHDVWVARGMTGDSFFNIPTGNGTWDYAPHLLWNYPNAQNRLYAHEPFQVFLLLEWCRCSHSKAVPRTYDQISQLYARGMCARRSVIILQRHMVFRVWKNRHCAISEHRVFQRSCREAQGPERLRLPVGEYRRR